MYLDRLCSRMAVAFPDARFNVPADALDPVWSPDSGDRHVIAAAILGRADVIVTDDQEGFPDVALPEGLSAQAADVFLEYSLDLHPRLVVSAVESVAARTGRHGPRRTAHQIAEMLTDRGLRHFGERLAEELRG